MDELTRNGQFRGYEDHLIISQIRDFRAKLELPNHSTKIQKIDALLNREPPKLVASYERLAGRDEQRAHKNLASQLREKIPRWAEHFGIPEDLWHFWESSLTFSKIGSHIAWTDASAGGFEEEAQQAV